MRPGATLRQPMGEGKDVGPCMVLGADSRRRGRKISHSRNIAGCADGRLGI